MSFYVFIKLLVFNKIALKKLFTIVKLTSLSAENVTQICERFLLTHFLIPLFIVHYKKILDLNISLIKYANNIFQPGWNSILDAKTSEYSVGININPFIYAFCEFRFVYRCQYYIFQEIYDKIEYDIWMNKSFLFTPALLLTTVIFDTCMNDIRITIWLLFLSGQLYSIYWMTNVLQTLNKLSYTWFESHYAFV